MPFVLPFGWLKGIWAIVRWEEPKSPVTPQRYSLTFVNSFIMKGHGGVVDEI